MSDEPHLLKRAVADLRHNLRTPLNHIIGYSEILIEDAEEREDVRLLEALRPIHVNAKDLVGVIQNALPPAMTEIGDRELADLRAELQEPVRSIITAAGILLESSEPLLARDLETIRGAAERLLNLAVEAQHHPSQAEAEVLVYVASEGDLPKGKLLVVDDNTANRDLLSRRLEREGYSVAQAANGRQALTAMREDGVELVLLDIMMPEMDGYQVLEAMKRDDVLQAIPVIVISALDETRSVARCIEMGAEDYLRKPFDPVHLRARVGACLEKKRLRDSERRRTEELEQTIERLKQGKA